MKLNNKGFAITTILYGTLILFLLLLVSMLGILASYNDRLGLLIDSNNGARCIINDNCDDFSIPNKPVLDDGMIPVLISSDGTVTVVSEDDPNWYNYTDKRWANAVLVDEQPREEGRFSVAGTVIPSDYILAYYVWVPRYKYKVFSEPSLIATNDPNFVKTKPTSIKIIFESNDEKSNGEYLTHPAFTFGGTELSGIWVGKFETTGTDSEPTILPGLVPRVGQSISQQFETSLIFSGGDYYSQRGEVIFSGNSYYGLSADTDSHMMKNSEWGAVVYLSHSKYGINGQVHSNPYDTQDTGCGTFDPIGNIDLGCQIRYGTKGRVHYPQSTTGNITGVFDMSGGESEAVMGVLGYYDTDLGRNVPYSGVNSGFNGIDADGNMVNNAYMFPESKYYDLYIGNFTDCTVETCGGHALYETYSWYDDFGQFVHKGDVWYARGYYKNIQVSTVVSEYGEKYGIFNFSNHNGSGSEAEILYAWRSVLVIE